MPGEIIDSDQHTLADGAFMRFLKMRKWMVLTGAGLVLLKSDMLAFEALSEAIFLRGISKDAVWVSLSWTAFYQFLMLLAVLVQLRDRYPAELLRRLERGPFGELFVVKKLRKSLEQHEQIRDQAEREMNSFDFDTARTPVNLAEDTFKSASSAIVTIKESITRNRRATSRIIVPEIAIDALRTLPTIAFFSFATLLCSRPW